jgi:hypothetical protein
MRQNQFLFLLAAVAIGVLSFSCSDDNNSDNSNNSTNNLEVVYAANLTGANERPAPTPSNATGDATLIFNNKTKIFTLVVNYSGMVATAGHIHNGGTDVAGPVVFPFANLMSPINYTSTPLTPEQESDLNAGLYYVNLYSATYPGGEIRGQLIKK